MINRTSPRIEFFTIFERVPKWRSWGILVEWFGAKGYHAEWFDKSCLGMDGVEDHETF